MKHALVTGGSRGLGRALVEELLQRGYRVDVIDVLPFEPAQAVTLHELDLARFDPASIADLPCYDLLICNAGITAVGDFKNMPAATDLEVLSVNTIGHMNLVKQLLRFDKLEAGGRVAFTNSASVYVPWPVAIAYATSKAALDGFALALESYLTGRGISVTRVFPGAMQTEHGGYAKETGAKVGVLPERVAPRIIRGILRRRRRVFPDLMGRMLSAACSVFPMTMSRLIYRKLDLDAGG